MKMKQATQLRVSTGAPLPKRLFMRHGKQEEETRSTPEESRAILLMVAERCFLPVLRGEVSIRDSITPPGGWARLDEQNPGFNALSIQAQLRYALLG